LLAADLIARGFWAASNNTYQRIIVIPPTTSSEAAGHLRFPDEISKRRLELWQTTER
jgi:hypothetical protein